MKSIALALICTAIGYSLAVSHQPKNICERITDRIPSIKEESIMDRVGNNINNIIKGE